VKKEPLSPEFLAAGAECTRLRNAGLSQTPEGAQAFRRMYDAAPEFFRKEMRDMAVQMGLMPKVPDGYTDEGHPLYRLEGIAKRLGVSEEEAQSAARELGIQPGESNFNRTN